MPWSKEKHREYRQHGDGRDKKREADRAYQQKNKEKIKAAQYSRPIAPDAPKTWTCKKCGTEKPFTPEFFTYRPGMKFKLTFTCRRCLNDASLTNQVMRNYGMTLEEAKEFRSRKCWICGEGGRIHIDHSHKTGKVRKALCSRCNVGLGYFREREDLLNNAIIYVRLHRE